ncbi:hypothetical protein F5Y12DRAFT_710824 [Xylaria sp. FL1777]|nr:hypothetical protein F5Y12DRAFT_710824 [Xylaria sp. FL1777]
MPTPAGACQNRLTVVCACGKLSVALASVFLCGGVESRAVAPLKDASKQSQGMAADVMEHCLVSRLSDAALHNASLGGKVCIPRCGERYFELSDEWRSDSTKWVP